MVFGILGRLGCTPELMMIFLILIDQELWLYKIHGMERSVSQASLCPQLK
jgi:hypothetical protein